MAPFDTYPKIMDAVRSIARAIRGCNLPAVGDPKDVDARTKGKGKGKKWKGEGNEKERSSKSENKDATYNKSDTECLHCKTKGHIARHCKKRMNDDNAKAGQYRDNSKVNCAKCETTLGSTGDEHVQSSSWERIISSRITTSPQSSTTCSNVGTDGKTSCSNSIITSRTM